MYRKSYIYACEIYCFNNNDIKENGRCGMKRKQFKNATQ